jgi:hypothetical protein
MILEAALSVIGGFVGNMLTTYSNYKMEQLKQEGRKQDRVHELAMVEAQTKAMIAEVEANIKVTQTTVQGQVDLEEAKAFTLSQQVVAQKNLSCEWIELLLKKTGGIKYLTIPVAMVLVIVMGVVDVLKSLMQPGLTLYSLAIASWVTYKAYEALHTLGIGAFSASDAAAMWNDAARMMLMLAITLVTWWFGDRRMSKHLMYLKETENEKTS